MLDIQHLRKTQAKILCIGSHHPIIQSMLDFDYLSGKKFPSVVAIIAGRKKFERFFFGNKHVLIPVYPSIEKIPQAKQKEITFIFNTTSARRTKSSTREALSSLPHVVGGTLFAEDVPEEHSLALLTYVNEHHKFLVGPASVGLLVPGSFKLGAIGGTDYRQLLASGVMTPGSVAVFSASGGMVGEIIRIVAQQGKRLSFALSFGGDRFPILSPKDAFLAAEKDPQTKAIVYYGELGGTDEYDLVALLESKQITKPVVCYIAGTVSDLFETPPQFGHAKAIAGNKGESAREKRDALKKAGAMVGETFLDFVAYIKDITGDALPDEANSLLVDIENRKQTLLTSGISGDIKGDATIMGEPILAFTKDRSFASIVSSMFLGKKVITKETEQFVDYVLRLLVDHGPYVSGAMNTIVTARAGRDLVSSLSAGLLTIGPRFGGAINQAAANWIAGVSQNDSANVFVEHFASKKQYISGIGHKKYRVDLPDPRVTALLAFTKPLKEKRFTEFALSIQKVTTAKKGNLILNVDGAIAAILLDYLSEKEGYSDEQLRELTEREFFNALFVLSRSVGFISHFLDQKRLDEGIFRLPEDLATQVDLEDLS